MSLFHNIENLSSTGMSNTSNLQQSRRTKDTKMKCALKIACEEELLMFHSENCRSVISSDKQ